MDFAAVDVFVVFLPLFAVVIYCLFAYAFITANEPNLKISEKEKSVINEDGEEKTDVLGDLFDTPTLNLSVVVPAYNEEKRLPIMLDEALDFLEKRQKKDAKFTYEVIVVDDGSSDKTTSVAHGYTKRFGVKKVKAITLEKNRGKGGAIQAGMRCVQGEILLFADADGATKFSDVGKLQDEIGTMEKKEGMGVVCGSRAHLEKDAIAQRSMFRTFLMKGFHFLVWFLCVRGVRDTQCGFKLFTRPAAQLMFSNLHVQRWAFDVELLHIAQHFQVPVSEVAVTWHEVDGTKLVPFWSWLQMGRDLLLIRVRYMIGVWKFSKEIKQQ